MTCFKRGWIALSLCLAVATAGCSSIEGERSDLCNQIDDLTSSDSETIDLSHVGSDDWSRLCVLTPYADNEVAEDVLGFAWDAEEKTNIHISDSIAVLVLASDENVETYVAYPRGRGDFSFAVSEPSCLERDRTQFARQQNGNSVSFVLTE